MNEPLRLARIDQDRAAIDEAIDGLILAVREVQADYDPSEVLLAVVESLADQGAEMVAMIAAGALLRLAGRDDSA